MQVAKPNASPKNVSNKMLQTIDDPYFDEDTVHRPQDAGPGGGAPRAGSGRSGSLRGGPGIPARVGAVAAGGEGKCEHAPKDPTTSSKSVVPARSGQPRRADRAMQRRLNLFIGTGVFGIALIVLFFLTEIMLSRSRGDYGSASGVLQPVGANANDTEDRIDVEDLRHAYQKSRTTPEKGEYEDYEVITPQEDVIAMIDNKSDADNFLHGLDTAAIQPPKVGHVYDVETANGSERTFSVSTKLAFENATLGHSPGESIENAAVYSAMEKFRNKSAYSPEGKRNSSAIELTDRMETAVSPNSCSRAYETQMAFLLSELDRQYSTCNNLYEHVCSKWQRRYSWLADERGSYSVDDSVLDGFEAKLARHLLKADRVSYHESRHFFEECVKGVQVTKDNVQKLIHHLKIDHSASSAEALAETFVRACRVGVSPFFNVAVKREDSGFAITLLPSSSTTRKYELYIHKTEGVNRTQLERHKQGGTGKNPRADIPSSETFLQALEHHLCGVVIREHGSGANCFLTTDSVITPSWDYEWYKSSGLNLLAFHAASTFWPFFVPPETVDTESNYSFPENYLENANQSTRVEACLRLVNQYDPHFVSQSALAITGKEFVKRGKPLLESLKRTLAQRIHWASNISLQFGSLHSLARNSAVLNNSSDPNSIPWPINSTILESYLLNMTWKVWTQGIYEPSEVLSTSPTFDHDSSTVYVPLPVFDLSSSIENPWFWHLSSTARVGPRFLKPILLLVPPKLLEGTDLIRCLRNQSTQKNETKTKTRIGSLDVEEVAAFAYSLEAFHSMTLGEPAPPVHNVSTDALFLYYYVFNKCTALPSNENRAKTSLARHTRHEVESVAAVFGGSLLQECASHLDLQGCLTGSKEYIV